MSEEIREALEKNNTTEGRLSAVLALADKYYWQLEELKKRLQPPPLVVSVADGIDSEDKPG